MEREAILSLGSNLGDRMSNINSTLKMLAFTFGIQEIIVLSKFYETEPLCAEGYENHDKNKYINCCVRIKTILKPEILLGVCFGIESAIGRRRTYKYASREIDVDILLMSLPSEKFIEIKNDFLTLPHHGLYEQRDFILAPLADVCDGYRFCNFDFLEDYKKINWNFVRLLS
ncbi:MAG: 2-amino-4-hydroxy-6-hydroxymethyldihydropteridine diphosphokinase [Firmicutes bacterium]|nr:2-amino-4-hydroxy-6-hydroxymethyldihydropteridine diphosphokinase [Bacillota bacterium]